MVLHRLNGKQPAPAERGNSKGARKVKGKIEASKRTKATKKKAVTTGAKPTKLALAKTSGLVATAQRPFALFCKERKLRVQDAKHKWKELSEKEQEEFRVKSKQSFAEQRRQSSAAGVYLRNRQLGQNEDLSLVKQTERTGGFAAFLKTLWEESKSG